MSFQIDEVLSYKQLIKSHNPFKLDAPKNSMNESNRLKIAVISGASHALQYRKENPRASDEEILRQITREITQILAKIGQEE